MSYTCMHKNVLKREMASWLMVHIHGNIEGMDPLLLEKADIKGGGGVLVKGLSVLSSCLHCRVWAQSQAIMTAILLYYKGQN